MCGISYITTRFYSALKKGKVSPMRSVPYSIMHPDYASNGQPAEAPRYLTYYSWGNLYKYVYVNIFSKPYIFKEDEIKYMRESAQIARYILDFANSKVEPGITTDEIDRLAHEEVIRIGAYPTPLNYYGFPKSICTSVNEVLCHGIPDDRPLEDGDIISIDVSIFNKGYHGDNCGTVIAGKKKFKDEYCMNANMEALDAAIQKCGPGV
jgi:methionyl aminopeptidase